MVDEKNIQAIAKKALDRGGARNSMAGNFF